MAVPPVMPLAGANSGQISLQPLARRKIRHVVIIVQENRSFNNLFYGYPGARTVRYGYACVGKMPDVATVMVPGCGQGSKRIKVRLKPIGLATRWQLEHNPNGFIAACNGTGIIPGTDCRMNGFNLESWNCSTPHHPKCPIEYPPYAYVPHEETKPYIEMARQYVLADKMFASNFDSTSFMSHQFIIAGTNPEKTIGIPQTWWGCPGGNSDRIAILGLRRVWPKGYVRACWDQRTLGDELNAAGISWSFYATPIGGSPPAPCGHNGIDGDGSGSGSSNGGGIWSAYQAIEDICYKKKEWDTHILTPPKQFLKDIGGGKFSSVTWITPTWLNSDHGGSGSSTGPSWVTSLVNAIGESQYWNSTAIFIFWDDYGGWFDPEAPAHVDDAGLGMRLPLLIISPYARKSYVDHTPYEHGTILKFVEDIFGLRRLAASDKRARPPNDAFDFSQNPRKFVPINAPLGANYFLQEPADGQLPDSD